MFILTCREMENVATDLMTTENTNSHARCLQYNTTIVRESNMQASK